MYIPCFRRSYQTVELSGRVHQVDFPQGQNGAAGAFEDQELLYIESETN